MSKREMMVTPLVESSLIGLAVVVAVTVGQTWSLGLPACVFVFWASLVLMTIVTLKVIRTLMPLREGRYRLGSDGTAYVWSLCEFLCVMNLAPFYHSTLIPQPFRKFLYQLLGASIGPRVAVVSGRLSDCSLIVIQENALLGEDSLLLPHAIGTAGGEDYLVLGRIVVKRGAIVGARAVVMPGAIVGENAMVLPNSIVTARTVIPAGEVWGGVPARRVTMQGLEKVC